MLPGPETLKFSWQINSLKAYQGWVVLYGDFCKILLKIVSTGKLNSVDYKNIHTPWWKLFGFDPLTTPYLPFMYAVQLYFLSPIASLSLEMSVRFVRVC